MGADRTRRAFYRHRLQPRSGRLYYVNMPSDGNRSITFTSTDLAFMVYDDGGKDGNYGHGAQNLQLKAPEGCCFEIEGKITGLNDDQLFIYESTPKTRLSVISNGQA